MIYDENGNFVENPDLTLGHVYTHHRLDGRKIQIYHAFTQEELEAIEAERNKPTQEERIKALEEQLASYEAAYAQGVNEA